MQIEKRVKFLLLLVTLFILSLPIVFADIFSYGYGAFTSLTGYYQQYQGWFDFFTFFLIISSAVRLGFARLYSEGKEEPTGAAGIYLGFGIAGGLGMALLMANKGWTLMTIAPFVIFGMLFITIVAFYLIVAKKDKLSWGPAILFILLTLIFMGMLFPEEARALLDTPFLGFLFTLLIGLGIIALLFTLIGLMGSKVFNSLTDSGRGGSGNQGGTGPNSTHAADRQESLSRVKILITPDNRDYEPGTQLTLIADIKRSRFRFGGRRQGNYHCEWFANRQPLQGNTESITHTIPLNTRPENYRIEVIVRDVDTNALGRADRTIRIVNLTNLRLAIQNPVASGNILTIAENDPRDLTFTYQFNGTQPTSLTTFAWILLPGGRRPVTEAEIAGHSALLGTTNNLTLPFAQHHLILQPGEHTIAIVALNQLHPVRMWINPVNNAPLFDTIYINVTPNQGGTNQRNNPEFFLNVLDRNRTVISRSQADFSMRSNLNESFYLVPEINNGNLADYNINMVSNTSRNEFRYMRNATIPSGILRTLTSGMKTITCTFERNGTIENTIELTVNVGAAGTNQQNQEIPTLNVHRSIGNRRNPIPDLTTNQNPNNINATIGEILYFEPTIQNGNLNDYLITWDYPARPDRWAEINGGTRRGTLVIRSPGTKTIRCLFMRTGTNQQTELIIDINVPAPGTNPYNTQYGGGYNQQNTPILTLNIENLDRGGNIVYQINNTNSNQTFNLRTNVNYGFRPTIIGGNITNYQIRWNLIGAPVGNIINSPIRNPRLIARMGGMVDLTLELIDNSGQAVVSLNTKLDFT